jgi:hypothetical protein
VGGEDGDAEGEGKKLRLEIGMSGRVGGGDAESLSARIAVVAALLLGRCRGGEKGEARGLIGDLCSLLLPLL